MISITPPATPKYIPQTQAIAFVAVFYQLQPMPGGAPPRLALRIDLRAADQTAISFDPKALKPMTPDQIAAWLATPAHAGDTAEQDCARRTLPYLAAAYGLDGAVV